MPKQNKKVQKITPRLRVFRVDYRHSYYYDPVNVIAKDAREAYDKAVKVIKREAEKKVPISTTTLSMSYQDKDFVITKIELIAKLDNV